MPGFARCHVRGLRPRAAPGRQHAAAVLAGCSRGNDRAAAQTTDAQLPAGHVPIASAGAATGPEPLTQAFLDSGNAAFRQKDYTAALAFHAKARDVQPDHAAPWFGTYRVAEATRNTALADSAMRMVRARAPELQGHPGGTPAPGALPVTPGAPPSNYSPHQATPRDKHDPATAPRS